MWHRIRRGHWPAWSPWEPTRRYGCDYSRRRCGVCGLVDFRHE